MKKLYTILNAAFWCFIGVFLGVSLYTCWDYRATPGCMRCNLHRGI